MSAEMTREEAHEAMDKSLVVLHAFEHKAREIQDALTAAREEIRQARKNVNMADGTLRQIRLQLGRAGTK